MLSQKRTHIFEPCCGLMLKKCVTQLEDKESWGNVLRNLYTFYEISLSTWWVKEDWGN